MPDSSDLRLGDILLSVGHFDTASHKFIQGGQIMTLALKNAVIGTAALSGSFGGFASRDTTLCHAMIYIGDFQVAEAVGRGITINDIEFPHTYRVFRYRAPGLAQCVADTAKNWAMPEAGTYKHSRCLTSPFSISGLGFFGKRQVEKMSKRIDKPLTSADSMICTEFAILCWNATSVAKNAGYAINADAKSCTPMELGHRLGASEKWQDLGSFEINEYGGGGRARRGAVG